MKAERQQKEAFPRAIQYEKKNRAYMVDNRFNAIKQTKLLNNCLSEKRNKEFETTCEGVGSFAIVITFKDFQNVGNYFGSCVF